MHKHFSVSVLASFVLLTGSTCRIWADDPEDQRLQMEEKAIDTQPSASSKQSDLLAKQYNLETSKIEAMRQSGKGWGGVSIELAMAQELMKKDPTTYPTLDSALQKVGALRADGKGYGAIAKELGFKLGPVISAAQRTRNELRHESRVEAGMVHPEKPDHAGKPDRVGRPENVGKPDHASRPERVHPNHP